MRIILLLIFALPLLAERQAIVLDRTGAPSDDNVRVALWADVPAARQPFYARVGAVSQFKDATAGENAAIASGAVTETVETITFVAGTSNAARRAKIEERSLAWQTLITNTNLWSNFGSRFKPSTGWAAGGVN